MTDDRDGRHWSEKRWEVRRVDGEWRQYAWTDFASDPGWTDGELTVVNALGVGDMACFRDESHGVGIFVARIR